MYKLYIVPDATTLSNHSDLYNAAQLLWDPYTESDVYAVLEGKWKGELNKADSVDFSILPSNIHYNDFHKRKSVVLLYDDNILLFEGVVADAPVNFYKQRNVKCSGPLTYLCDSIQAPDEKNVVEIPNSSMNNTYMNVPDEWLANSNPSGLNWYERVYDDSDGEFEYTHTSDQAPIAGKSYYYKSVGDGENHSGQTIVKKGATSESITEHITRLLNIHNSQVDAFKRIHPGNIAGGSTKHDFDSSNFRTTWDALKSDILDEYGRYFRIRFGNDNKLYLDYLGIADMATGDLPLIEFANNMREFGEADNADDNIFTVLVPIGKDNLTVKDVNGHNSPEHNDNRLVDPYIASWEGNRRYVVVSPRAISEYGYIVKPQTFSDISKAADLYNRAVEYIKNNYDDNTEYDVKALDLHIINGTYPRIAIANKCAIKSTWHGVNVQNLYVITAERDLVNPENDSFKIGMPTSDREAMNRTLTGQSNNAKRKQSKDAASASSGVSRLNSILEEYIHVTEWGLEMTSRLHNKVESNDKKYTTEFTNDEYHINLAAQKLFGHDEDGVGDLDAGYVKVLKSNYRKGADGPYRSPKDERWYEKKIVDGKERYVLSTDTTCDPSVVGNKDYYVQNLWTRYSNIDVGQGGIKARVDGNYARSTASSSWLDVNEESILALTGHLYVDDDGHVHVTSGSGMLTNDSSEPSEPTFIPVSKTMYKNSQGQDVSPLNKQWYEPVLDSSNAWIGEGKADKATNPSYYKVSRDTTVDRSKQYYYYTRVREKFSSQFGIYDEDNLTAGIMVRAINNPSYKLIPKDARQKAQAEKKNPHNLGWYEYNNQTGLYGITLDDKVLGDGDDMKEYFEVSNNMQTYTNVMGDHVVIGGRLDENGDPIIFENVDDATKARIEKYMSGRNLDGTVTEIASDVLYAKAIITNYINVLSTKLFGNSDDDSDFVVVKAAGTTSNKNPSANGWYEKSPSNNYFLSADATAERNKTYYITRLTSRVTDFEVGEGGIHATVKGNYDRSIASQAWITANEEKLEMLLGHIGEDENGNLVIDSGNGFRSGYTTATAVTARYVLVLRSQYAGANPRSLGWKERKIGTDGRWVGAGKTDADTNSNYYVTTSDTSADYTKQYFVSSNTAETFVSEYGIYDQGNLTAGVVAQAVNNPKYHTIRRVYQSKNVNPSTASTVKLEDGSTVSSMWYVYDSEHGTYGRTTDTTWTHGHVYYYVENNMSTYTDLRGEHIVIGSSDGYSGLDNATKNKVNKYINDHNLDGTITEIASDVVTVNTLLAKYIEADEIVADTSLSTDNLDFNYGMCFGSLEFWTGSGYPTQGTTITFGYVDTGYVDCSAVVLASSSNDEIVFGDSGTGIDVSGAQDPAEIIMGFGEITTDGDTVTIPYLTAGDSGSYDEEHVLTFDKPASLGNAVWSSGSAGVSELKVYTTGGWAANPKWTFYHAVVSYPTNYVDGAEDSEGNPRIAYSRTGSALGAAANSGLSNKATIKAHVEITGDDYDKNGNAVAFSHDVSADSPVISGWSKYIYVDAQPAYDDGWDHARSLMDWPSTMQAIGERTVLTIKYPGEAVDPAPADVPSTTFTLLDEDTKGSSGYIRVRRDYVDADHPGTLIGAIQVGDWYDAGWDDAVDDVGTEAAYGGDDYSDGEEFTLDYSDSVVVKAGYFNSSGMWCTTDGITVKSKEDRYDSGYDDAVDTLAIDPSTGSTLDYGDDVTVTAKVTKRDGTDEEKSITITAAGKPTISSPSSATAPEGVTPTALSYGTTYEVHLVHNNTNRGNNIYFTAPADNSATLDDLEIDNSNSQKVTSVSTTINGSDQVLYPWVKISGTWHKGTNSCTVKCPSKSYSTMYYKGTETSGDTTYYVYWTTDSRTPSNTALSKTVYW